MHSLSLERVPVTPVMAKTISRGDGWAAGVSALQTFFSQRAWK